MTSERPTIRVLIADDHLMMLQGLRSFIAQEPDMVVVAEAHDGAEAVVEFRRVRPDVCVLDLQMPGTDGLEAIASIRAESVEVGILALTTYGGDARVARAMALGATCYLLKTASIEEVIDNIRDAFNGRRRLDDEVVRDLAAHRGDEPLNGRDLAVLRLVAQGMSNRTIGEQLHLAEDTVKSRMKAILGKLHASDRTHAVTIARQRGFLHD